MLTKLVRVGNSRGVRLPKAVIEQAHLEEDIDLEVRGDAVILRPAHTLREGWTEAAAACHDAGEDDLADWDGTVGDFADDWS
ncbi:MAG: AbrB/MazE/SpoVT family DNA-binding domain-containing protein [Planctomycetota bacterium]